MRTILALVLVGHTFLPAQIANAPELWPATPMGLVTGLAASGSTLYAAGDFASVARPVLNLALVQAQSGAVTATPWMNELVAAAVADPGGGWFLGGRFTTAQGAGAQGLVRVDAGGAPVPGWSAPVQGEVSALALEGNVLYVAGRFTHVGGQPRGGLAAVDAATGAVLPVSFGNLTHALPVSPFIPAPSAHDLAVVGGVLYVAGFFEAAAGVSRHGFAAFDRMTGALLPWFPSFGTRSVGFPFSVTTTANAGQLHPVGGAMLVTDGVGTIARTVDLAAGTPGALSFTTNGGIFALADDGTTLYLGGEFSTLAGLPRTRLAAMDLSSGAVLPLAPVIPSGRVLELVVEGQDLLVGGFFTSVDGQTRGSFARLDRATGGLLGPDLGVVGTVYALASNGAQWVIGGSMSAIASTPRKGLAAFDASTTALLPLAVDVAAPAGTSPHPRAVACIGSALFFSGAFTTVAGQARPGLAAVDRNTGALLPFSPPALGVTTDTRIVAGTTGLLVYNPWATVRTLTMLDASTGIALWTVTADQPIQDVQEGPGGVYATGIFTMIDGQPAPRIARIDPFTGVLLPFAASLEGPGYGRGLAVGDEAVFVCGTFNAVNSVPRNGYAAVDPFTGALQIWTPLSPPSGTRDLLLIGPAVASVPQGSVNMTPTLHDRMTAQLLPWSPPAGQQEAMAVAGGRLVRGGSFPLAPNQFPAPGLISHLITMPQASSTVIGSGCASPPPPVFAPPTLGSSLPALGSTLLVTVQGPAFSGGSMWFGLAPAAPLSIGNGCFVHLDLATALELYAFVTDASGTFVHPTYLPPQLALTGATFRLQALLVPPGGGYGLTNGLELTLGYAVP